MSSTNSKLNLAFNHYYSSRAYMAGAITPEQEKELVAQLRRELNEDGRVPLPAGPVKMNPSHPAVRAAKAAGVATSQ